MGAEAPLTLVTGPRGYVGGRLVAHLQARGHALRPVSRSDGSLLDAEFAARACAGVAHIVHLAAPNEIESEADPLAAITGTVSATVSLLRAARAAGVRRFVYVSTAHVYGSPLAGEIDERTLARPVHPYAITHRAAEDFVLAADRAGMEAVVLRLSNAIGAPARPDVQRWTLLANDLARQAVTARRLTLRSSGLQWRDFVAMNDVCRAIEHVATAPAAAVAGRIFNLGSGQALRVIDLTERIRDRCAAVLGFTPEIERPEPRPGESSPSLVYRVDELRGAGFTPRSALDDEIDETLRFCRAHFA